jgi:hypothetical protein
MLCSYSTYALFPISSWTPQVPYLYMQVSQCVYHELYLTPTYNAIVWIVPTNNIPQTLNPKSIECKQFILCRKWRISLNNLHLLLLAIKLSISFFPYSPNIESIKTCANFSSVTIEHLTELIKRNTNAQPQIRKLITTSIKYVTHLKHYKTIFKDPFQESLQ